MLLALSSLIPEIDRFSAKELGIPVQTLMGRAGHSVAEAVRKKVEPSSFVVLFAGKGNNGGDAYAAATDLIEDYDVLVYDVFSAGQKSEEGKYFLNLYKEKGGKVENFIYNDKTLATIKKAKCFVDGIFGTGFKGTCPPIVEEISKLVSESVGAVKIAIDIPFGIDGDNGSIRIDSVCNMQTTVALSFINPGLVSYPAKAYVGEIIYDDLNLPKDIIRSKFKFTHFYVDDEIARELLPLREENSSKGTFGKMLCITGSSCYRGAAHLSLEGALRGGVGYVTYIGEKELCKELSAKFPEAIYKPLSSDVENITDGEIEEIVELSKKNSSTLIGSGCGQTKGLQKLVLALLRSDGGSLILDADAINVLSELKEDGIKAIKESKRYVVLTPHPLEFSRLVGKEVSYIQMHRIEEAIKFCVQTGKILVLKGAGTVTTDGEFVFINSSGSSALAKAGSGDVLAGTLSSVIGSGVDILGGSVLAVYFHGKAADNLAKEYSTLGVTPSDLPKEIGKAISKMKK